MIVLMIISSSQYWWEKIFLTHLDDHRAVVKGLVRGNNNTHRLDHGPKRLRHGGRCHSLLGRENVALPRVVGEPDRHVRRRHVCDGDGEKKCEVKGEL